MPLEELLVPPSNVPVNNNFPYLHRKPASSGFNVMKNCRDEITALKSNFDNKEKEALTTLLVTTNINKEQWEEYKSQVEFIYQKAGVQET